LGENKEKITSVTVVKSHLLFFGKAEMATKGQVMNWSNIATLKRKAL